MKSFRQYISEVATEVPKKPRFHHASHTLKDGNTSSHQYTYHDHDQHVHIEHSHKDPHGRGVEGKHHSIITFAVGGADHRTGKEGVKSASQKLSNVSHSIGHHIDKVVEPNMKHHGEHYFSYHVSKDHDDSGRNPKARQQTYHKMGKRLMKRHGYEYHKTIEGIGDSERHVFKKSGKKK